MIAAILEIVGGIGGALAALTTLSTTIFAVLWRRSENRRKEAETKARTMTKAREVQNDVQDMGADERRDRLARWMRDQ